MQSSNIKLLELILLIVITPVVFKRKTLQMLQPNHLVDDGTWSNSPMARFHNGPAQ
jgi:hypothetical protein